MVHDGDGWRLKARCAVLALLAAALPLALDGSVVQAQSIMRSPNLNIAPRVTARINPTVGARVNPTVGPRINPTATTRINPNITARAVVISRTTPIRSVPRIGLTSTLPYVRYSPNLYPPCSDSYRDGGCWDQSVSPADDGGGGAVASKSSNNGPRRDGLQTTLNLRTIGNELVAEIDGSLSDTQADELARRHGLERLQSQNFPLIGGTIGLFRINDRRAAAGGEPRTRRRRRCSLGATELSLCPPGPEDSPDRGRSCAIRGRQTSIARGPQACRRRQCNRCRDQFRDRRQTSGTRQLDRGQLRCPRQQRGAACPRHRRGWRDRVACPADGERAGGQDLGDPRFRQSFKRRRKHVVRHPERRWTTPRRTARKSSI